MQHATINIPENMIKGHANTIPILDAVYCISSLLMK